MERIVVADLAVQKLSSYLASVAVEGTGAAVDQTLTRVYHTAGTGIEALVVGKKVERLVCCILVEPRQYRSFLQDR